MNIRVRMTETVEVTDVMPLRDFADLIGVEHDGVDDEALLATVMEFVIEEGNSDYGAGEGDALLDRMTDTSRQHDEFAVVERDWAFKGQEAS